MADPIHDDDVHNPPSANIDEDFHNGPVSSTQIDPTDVPEFERDIASNTQLKSGSQANTIAQVDPDNSNSNITVDKPEDYTAGVQAHELVHNIQRATGDVNPVNTSQAATSQAAHDAVYDYGGTEGLDKVMKSGGISKLNDEQQAKIPENYMTEYNAAVKKGDTKAVDRLNQVYQPAIKQLRDMANPSKDKINTTPDAPAGAPAELLGLAKPVKGMASNSTKSAAVRNMVVDNPKGLAEKGNLNIDNRPTVKNDDGSYSTEYSTSFEDKGKEVLVPTIVNGKFLTPNGKKPPEGSAAEKQMFKNAFAHYKQTGEHLGKFSSPAAADAYAIKLHNRGNEPAPEVAGSDPHSKALRKAKKALGGS